MFSINIDDHWKLKFTDLALEPVEVEVQRSPIDFLLNFKVNPRNETLKVNSPTRATAFAGIK